MFRKLFHLFERNVAAQSFGFPSKNVYRHCGHTRFFNFNGVNNFPSVDGITHIDTSNVGCAKVYNEDDSYSEIGSFSKLDYQQFVNLLNDKVTITLAYRKAWWPSNPLPLTHGVLLVSDGENQAIFGYQKVNGQGILINDLTVDSSDGNYLLYNQLRIKGNAQQATSFLGSVAKSCGEMRFTGIHNNCYTPLVTKFAKADKYGFKTPTDFLPTLLETLPKEQNFGMGTSLHFKFEKFFKGISNSKNGQNFQNNRHKF